MSKGNEILLPKFKKWGDTMSHLSEWCTENFVCYWIPFLSSFKFTKIYLTSKFDYSGLYIM